METQIITNILQLFNFFFIKNKLEMKIKMCETKTEKEIGRETYKDNEKHTHFCIDEFTTSIISSLETIKKIWAENDLGCKTIKNEMQSIFNNHDPQNIAYFMEKLSENLQYLYNKEMSYEEELEKITKECKKCKKPGDECYMCGYYTRIQWLNATLIENTEH